jgi:tetratricopeptide (TPR) repeat protein
VDIPAGRRWLWRVVTAVVIPLLALALVETGFRLNGYGYPTAFLLPTPDGERLVSNPRYGWRFFPAGMARTPEPVVLQRRKPASSLRVVVLGGSAALGFPESAFGFSRYLEVALRERAPDLGIEVANAAMTAIDSTVVREIAADCLRYEPDVLIVMTGNNEVVGPFGPGCAYRQAPVSAPLRLLRLHSRRSRFGQWLGTLADRRTGLHFREWGGMGAFQEYPLPNVEDALAPVYRQFRHNLAAISRAASGRGVPVLLLTVPVNLRDSAPFASGHDPTLGASELAAWNDHWAAGSEAEARGDRQRALESYQSALELDAAHAELHYRLGRLLLDTEPDRGRDHLRRARDLDRLHFRADSSINAAIREMAEAPAVTVVDAAAHLEELAPHRSPGEEFFFEHVHLTPEGTYRVAEAVWPHLLEIVSPLLRQPMSSPSMPSRARCERLLGFDTDSHTEMVREVMVMMTRPPFETQSGSREQVAKLDRAGRALRRESAASGNPDADQGELRELVRRFPRDVYFAERLAARTARSGDAAGALGLWRGLLEHHPWFYEWRTEQAQALADSRRTMEAMDEMQKVRAFMTAPQWHATAGSMLAMAGDRAKAEGHFREALRFPVGPVDAGANLGVILLERGQLEEARKVLERTAADAPVNANVWNTLGNVYRGLRETERAIEAYEKAVRYDPWHVPARVSLAVLHAGYGRLDAASRELKAALAIDDAFPPAHQAMGLLKANQGEHTAAVSHLRRALEMLPDDLVTLNALARLLATAPDADADAAAEATSLASRACELTGHRHPQFLDTLSIAHAAGGDYAEAVRVAERARALALQMGNRGLAFQIESRLGQYRSNLP